MNSIESFNPLTMPYISQTLKGSNQTIYNDCRSITHRLKAVKNSRNYRIKNQLENKSAKIIQEFFRKVIANISFDNMFSHDSYLKESINFLPRVAQNLSFRSLTHLDALSKYSLESIEKKTLDLKPQEQILLDNIIHGNIILRYKTNAALVEEGVLKIFSKKWLERQVIRAARYADEQDKQRLGNDDFVSFAIKFTNNTTNPSFNISHKNSYLGQKYYILPNEFPLGYFTLTKHVHKEQLGYGSQRRKDLSAMFIIAQYEVDRYIPGDRGGHDMPIFNQKDMKRALGLHLINFLRSTKDSEFRDKAFNECLQGLELNWLVNFVFEPTFHVPRMVVTKNFTEVNLGEQAIVNKNFERVD